MGTRTAPLVQTVVFLLLVAAVLFGSGRPVRIPAFGLYLAASRRPMSRGPYVLVVAASHRSDVLEERKGGGAGRASASAARFVFGRASPVRRNWRIAGSTAAASIGPIRCGPAGGVACSSSPAAGRSCWAMQVTGSCSTVVFADKTDRGPIASAPTAPTVGSHTGYLEGYRSLYRERRALGSWLAKRRRNLAVRFLWRRMARIAVLHEIFARLSATMRGEFVSPRSGRW